VLAAEVKDLPEKLSTLKTAGFWTVLFKLGAVDPSFASNVARVAKRMGVDPPSPEDLDRMFPKGWESAAQGSWQAQLENSSWLKDVNSAKLHVKDVATGRARPSGGWTHGAGWKSQSVPVASRVARTITKSPGLYGLSGLFALRSLVPATRGVRRKARKDLKPKELDEVARKTIGRGVGIGAVGGGLLGTGIPLLAVLPQLRSAGGLRNLLRVPGNKAALIRSGVLTGLHSIPWGATAGGLIGSRFMPGAAEKVRERKKAAAEEAPTVPSNYLTKKFTVPSGILGAVGKGVDPPLQVALERLRQARKAGHTPSLGMLFKDMPPDMKKQILKGSLSGAIGGLATGYLTGRWADRLIQKKLKEKAI